MDEKLAEYFQKNIDRIDLLQKEKSNSQINLIKLIITILVGLLSVLVAFKKDKSLDYCNHILFASILTTIAIGIISGTAFLYHQIDELNDFIKFQKECLAKRFNGDLNSTLFIDVPIKLFFKICRYIFYSASILTILLLVYYGIRLDK